MLAVEEDVVSQAARLNTEGVVVQAMQHTQLLIAKVMFETAKKIIEDYKATGVFPELPPGFGPKE